MLTVESNAGTTSLGYYPANAETPNAGRLHWVEQPGGARVYYAYNARGQITSQWGTGAQPLRWIYDGLGQVKHLDTFLTRDPAAWAGPNMPALMASQELTGSVSRRTFAVSQGRLASRTFGMGEHPTGYEYHPDGSLQRKFTGNGIEPVVYSYDAAGRLSGLQYGAWTTQNISLNHDRSGRVQTRTDSAGTHSFNYQADGTVVETVSGGWWDGLVLTRRVDGAGRLAEVEWSFAGEQRVVKYDYDSHSRLNQASFGLVNQPPQVSASYHWLSGTRRVERLERPIAGSAQPLTGVFTHDGAGRLEKLEWQRGATLYGSHEYSFDAAGRRQTETRQDGTTLHYAYTARGELEQVERRRGDGSLRPDWTHGYAYDDSGNRATTDTPEGEHLIHEFLDANDLPYGGWGMRPRNEDPVSAGTLKSWMRGRAHPQALVKVNGQVVEREGEFWRYLHSTQNWELEQAIIEASRPDLPEPPPLVKAKRTPRYNYLGFRVNREGNMEFHNQTHGVYDEDDNRVGYTSGWELIWDAENRPRMMVNIETRFQPDGSQRYIRHEILFTYDALGRRIGKRSRGCWMTDYGNWLYNEETLFLWDGWTLLAEFVRGEENGPWHLRRGYLWGLDLSGSLEGAGGVGGLLWVVEHTPGRAESHRQLAPWYDGNGNVMGWVENEQGYTLPLWRLEYDPYGKLLVEDPVRVARHQKYRTLGIEEKWLHRPPVGFSTKYEDAETGLLYYGFRYYQPETGRWTSKDPIGERGGINLYGMVGNDPVNKVDVLGLAETTMPAKPPNCIVRLRQMHGPGGAHTYHTEYERSVDAMATAAGWSAGLHEAGIIGYPSFYGRLSLLSCEYAPAAGARFLIPGVKGSPAGAVGYSTSGTDTAPGGLAGRNYSNGGHGPFIDDYAAYVNESWQAALKEGNSLADKCGKDQCCACQEITVIFEAAADDHHRAWNNQPTLPYYNDFLDTPMAQHMNSSSPTIGNSGLPNIVDPNPKASLPTKVPNIPKSGQSFKFKVKR